MDENEILKDVADAVTEAPVTLTFDVTPQSDFESWLMKRGLKKSKRAFVIRRINYTNLMRISGLLVGIDMGVLSSFGAMEAVLRLMATNGRTVAEIVAIAIKNRRTPPSKKLINFVADNLDGASSEQVMAAVFRQMQTENFLRTLLFFRGVNVLMTAEAKSTHPGD